MPISTTQSMTFQCRQLALQTAEQYLSGDPLPKIKRRLDRFIKRLTDMPEGERRLRSFAAYYRGQIFDTWEQTLEATDAALTPAQKTNRKSHELFALLTVPQSVWDDIETRRRQKSSHRSNHVIPLKLAELKHVALRTYSVLNELEIVVPNAPDQTRLNIFLFLVASGIAIGRRGADLAVYSQFELPNDTEPRTVMMTGNAKQKRYSDDKVRYLPLLCVDFDLWYPRLLKVREYIRDEIRTRYDLNDDTITGDMWKKYMGLANSKRARNAACNYIVFDIIPSLKQIPNKRMHISRALWAVITYQHMFASLAMNGLEYWTFDAHAYGFLAHDEHSSAWSHYATMGFQADLDWFESVGFMGKNDFDWDTWRPEALTQ